MANNSAEIAIELRGKLEFYLLALAFSVLGLSIQTAQFGEYLLADVLELTGWLALFTSGVIGIMRAEWVPVAYEIQSKITSTRGRRADVHQGLQRGVQIQIPFLEGGKETLLAGEQAVAKLDSLVSTLEEQYKTTEDQIIRRYRTMRRAFMLGIGCLLLARGVPPAMAIGERLAVWLAS